jgi:hypothetical protein
MREALALVAPMVATVGVAVVGAALWSAPVSASVAPPVGAPHWTDGVAVCMAEDGSTPGQTFPCEWNARYQGDHRGESFTLTAAPDMDATP